MATPPHSKIDSRMDVNALTNFNMQNLGQLAVIAAALSYAFAGVWGKRFLSGYPPVVNALGMLVGSTTLMIPIAMMTEGMPVLSLSIEVWASLAGVAVLSTAVAYLLYFKLLVRTGSANLMLVTILTPLMAVTLSSTILGEKQGYNALMGLAFIAIGLAISDGRLVALLRKPTARLYR